MNILKELKKIIAEEIPGVDTEETDAETSLDDIGLDDSSAESLFMILEDRFGIAFPDNPGFDTLGDICAYIESSED